jgi:hypothetical protein
VETDVDLHNEFLVMGTSSGVLEMGTDVLLEIVTMAYVFQETGSVACGFQEMGTVACAFPEMGILAYALLEMEIDVYLVKTCVGQETFDVQEMVTSLTHELANDDGEEKVTFVTQTMVIFCEEEISSVKMGMDTLAMKVTLSLNKVISFLENAFGEKQSV